MRQEIDHEWWISKDLEGDCIKQLFDSPEENKENDEDLSQDSR
jgi:hypothetical protein